MGDFGSIIGGIGTAAAGGASIASAIQGKNAAEQAAKLQSQALGQAGSLGSQSSALGLMQLDLQRQLADRQISLANQILGETQPFRDKVLGQFGAGAPSAAAPPADLLAILQRHAILPDSGLGKSLLANPTGPEALAFGFPAGGSTAPATGANGLPIFTPTPFSVTPGERDVVEAQFRNAREATLANSPVRGGALASQLMDLQRGRAGTVVGLESDVIRRNQALNNQAAMTNFEAQLGERNMMRNLAAQIGFQAPGVAAAPLASAGSAFNPAAGGAIFGPAMNANLAAAGFQGQNIGTGNQISAGGGQALGSLAAAGKLASMKGGGKSNSGSSGFGK